MSALKRFLAIALCVASVAAACAQETAPPAASQTAAPKTISSDLQTCLRQTGDYVTRGKVIVYLIGITNVCDKRLHCEIFANVTGVKGLSLGHTVMILGPASSGAAATKSYAMRVKGAGGVVQVSRECRVL